MKVKHIHKIHISQIRKNFHYWDYYLMVPYLVLCMIGIVMVYSASSAIEMQNGGNPTSYLIKQTIYVIMGIGCLIFGANYPLRHYRTPRFLRDSTLVMVGMLLFVLVLSHAVNGAKGWINLGVINIQPVEICKIYFILYLSDRMARVRARNDHFISSGGGPWLVVALCLLLIVLQPDIGGMAINVMIVAVLFLACDFRWSFGISVLLIIPTMCYLLVEKAVESGLIHGYRMARFVAFLNPFGNASGSGSQLVNSYYAISNGGVFGSGLGNSVQKMGYLPEPNTDFIMSITSEELGLVGVSVILILLMIIICRMIQIGVRSNSMYEMLLCYGSATFILIEAFFNIGGVLGLSPITGVTFPFISYGGSSMLILSFTVGIIMNISIQQNKQRALRRSVRQQRSARG
ncbi:FtsW/RodA/SpoVE family cell cycle protein [Limosilactobacillus urinaemulieris]|uniref:FtsW/RodA/SpoVE family cell cycle protein n=1 Tax=Limosilactobacillus urinaemulieris TaxID=2742600 RepID=UPI0036F38C83